LLTGDIGRLYFSGTESFDNAAVSIGNGGNRPFLEETGSGGTLSLGPNLAITQTGFRAEISAASGSTIVNSDHPWDVVARRLKPTLHPPQWATKRLPVLRQTRTQQSRCAAGPEGGDVRGGRALAQEDLRRCHRKDSPEHDFGHGGDSLRPGRAWDARNLSQYLRSPRRRGHIQERASQQQIIGAGLVVCLAALVADEHVRGHVRR
jgi:hypothetical protein